MQPIYFLFKRRTYGKVPSSQITDWAWYNLLPLSSMLHFKTTNAGSGFFKTSTELVHVFYSKNAQPISKSTYSMWWSIQELQIDYMCNDWTYQYINLIKVSLLKMMDWKGKIRWSKIWLNTHTHTHILTLKGKALLMQTKASSVPDNELRRNISIELYTYILLYFVIYTYFLLFWTRRKSEIWRTYRINLSLDSREQGCFTASCRTCW